MGFRPSLKIYIIIFILSIDHLTGCQFSIIKGTIIITIIATLVINHLTDCQFSITGADNNNIKMIKISYIHDNIK